VTQKGITTLIELIFEKELSDSIQGIAEQKVVRRIEGSLAIGFLNNIKQEY